jgi:N-acetylglucosamine-6-phosphate deacetylase
MILAFVNGQILTASGFVEGRAVLVDGERICAITSADDQKVRSANCVDLAGRRLLPGYIDVQVNGGGGVLFNDAPTVEGISTIAAAHLRFGTTGFLATLISDNLDVVATAIAAVDSAIAAGVPGILGIHIEGPFLSAQRKGVHDAAHFLELGHEAVTLLSSLKRGVTLLTLAPERSDPAVIARLAAAGVILAAGHTNATAQEIALAQRYGVSGFTHLFNAMSQLTAREPGAVGAALADDESYCGIIVDGKHVDPRVLKIALRAKRHDRFMLITDAMPAVGTSAATFTLQGRSIKVIDDYCVDEQGTLAGTALNMSRAVSNAISLLGLPAAEAVRMASEYPARFLKLADSRGRIEPGLRADFAIADENGTVHETWLGGRCVPARPTP